jgi:GT2 family glycosyltransferase
MVARVDVVIPTYNGRPLLQRCLQALQRQTYPDFRAVVVDDRSSDDTREMLRRDFPDVTLIALEHNQGFAAAANAGIDAGASELVALLNNDTEPADTWLAELVAAVDRHADAAAVTSKLLLAGKPGHIHSAGDTFSRRGVAGNRGVWERDGRQYDAEEEVFGACAAAALYRRSALLHVVSVDRAVFDPDFVMYCEDVDLNWRLRLLGYRIIYAPGAVAHHHLSATGGGPLASYYVARNNFGVLAKNPPVRLLLRILPRFAFAQLLSFLGALLRARQPAARARLRGLLAGPWFGLRQLSKRRRIQAARSVDAAAIARYLSR